MEAKLTRQTLALAGVAQAAGLVEQVSKTGEYPAESLAPMVNSLFQFRPDSVADIYGGIPELQLGLQNLMSLLSGEDQRDNRDVARYVFSILYLERRFSRQADMVSVVRSRLQHIQFEAGHWSGHVNEVCHSLSEIYRDTLSTLKFRIRVSGNRQQLQNTHNVAIVRTLLMAGVRSAHLWHQVGGRRWKLALQRKAVLRCAQQLSREWGIV